jgi:glyoxylase-like metal-dependent hydrolase (beta-lactamase superfamily II)
MGIFYGMSFPAYTGSTIPVAEGETIRIGKDMLEVIFAPGHSPGHVCYYCREQQFLIGGDVLFQGSIGRTDLPGGNHQTLLTSIRTKLFVLPGETQVFSGHGPSTTIGEEKRSNPFFN